MENNKQCNRNTKSAQLPFAATLKFWSRPTQIVVILRIVRLSRTGRATTSGSSLKLRSLPIRFLYECLRFDKVPVY
ncbi:hypothetical protein BBBOND_0304200 [Babesia bigemina]|uniref:Uncharacterized protein n=1 Tax=Babesia bigemina TaxID=5866 RepID=A0A061D727_BABBI|nr:hypothetical protein BBBOND_0304200 [Babesia bigemina]CDR96516.1 hypothetical protein BBBOND_0304200 [Babesia bigemina]|eukprot:XP_012768702.1 hypothetical protein BBBOND_0304200 [Babesia bigemina]